MIDANLIGKLIEQAIKKDLVSNGPIAQQMFKEFGSRRVESSGEVDVTTFSDTEKKIIPSEDKKMSEKNSARMVYDAIKERVKSRTHWKLICMTREEFRNVILDGIVSGDIVIQGDIFGIEEQISKEIMLSNRFKYSTT